MQDLLPGMKVHYTGMAGEKENGIIKSINEYYTIAWVVYKCNNDWDNYDNYTGVPTGILDLSPEWV